MKEYNELSEFQKQTIDELNDLNWILNYARRKSLKIARELSEAAPTSCSPKVVQECAENAGWIHMCLCDEVDEHLMEIVKLINKVE